jgi:hypothetical protein
MPQRPSEETATDLSEVSHFTTLSIAAKTTRHRRPVSEWKDDGGAMVL